MMYGYGYGPDTGVAWIGMGLMWLFGLLFLVSVVLAIVWLVRRSAGPHDAGPGARTAPPQDTAMAVARERLARGEITPEEFDTIARALRG